MEAFGNASSGTGDGGINSLAVAWAGLLIADAARRVCLSRILTLSVKALEKPDY
jgi:hypothetical protein